MNNLYADKVSKQRRLKYGAFAVGLTAIVIALIVVINLVVSALGAKFGWYIDMTKENIFGVTEQTHDLLDGYDGTDEFSISIVFCQYADVLDGTYETRLVHNIAKKYAEEFDFVNIEYVDIINHPEAVNKYLTTSVSSPKTTSVYVVKHDLKNPAEEKHQSKIYQLESFYVRDEDTGAAVAFNGEYKFTVAILQLAGDNPVAYFSTGHGEIIDNTVLYSLFEDAGYDIKKIDLSKESFEDEKGKILVINSPKTDFMGASDTVNEIKKISDFLAGQTSLMVFFDPASETLPELESFLSEWGISFQRSKIRDFSNSLSVNGSELIADYATDGAGAQLTTTLRELASAPKPIVNNAMPIDFTYSMNSEGVYSSYITSSLRRVFPVLTTSPNKTAEALSLTDANAEPVKGMYNLMTISVDTRTVNNETQSSYILAAGTSSFADSKYIGGRQYANRDIIFNAMKAFGNTNVPLDLDFKLFEEETLTISKAQANVLTAVFTLVPAAIISVIGIAVYTRRRYL